eukprot:Amastigsp_a850937_81.p2 type:complete len:171 gc:universal Amastigsp_a850937_81:647-135(-)
MLCLRAPLHGFLRRMSTPRPRSSRATGSSPWRPAPATRRRSARSDARLRSQKQLFASAATRPSPSCIASASATLSKSRLGVSSSSSTPWPSTRLSCAVRSRPRSCPACTSTKSRRPRSWICSSARTRRRSPSQWMSTPPVRRPRGARPRAAPRGRCSEKTLQQARHRGES